LAYFPKRPYDSRNELGFLVEAHEVHAPDSFSHEGMSRLVQRAVLITDCDRARYLGSIPDSESCPYAWVARTMKFDVAEAGVFNSDFPEDEFNLLFIEALYRAQCVPLVVGNFLVDVQDELYLSLWISPRGTGEQVLGRIYPSLPVRPLHLEAVFDPLHLSAHLVLYLTVTDDHDGCGDEADDDGEHDNDS